MPGGALAVTIHSCNHSCIVVVGTCPAYLSAVRYAAVVVGTCRLICLPCAMGEPAPPAAADVGSAPPAAALLPSCLAAACCRSRRRLPPLTLLRCGQRWLQWRQLPLLPTRRRCLLTTTCCQVGGCWGWLGAGLDFKLAQGCHPLNALTIAL